MNFKSYCWSFGTTSFRVSELKYKIERQLFLLSQLFSKNPKLTWNPKGLQPIYFNYLVKEKLASSTSKDHPKDARQKTSSLKDLGLIKEDRTLTEIGTLIQEISSNNAFNYENEFFIRNDSYLYLKQFLKFEVTGRDYAEFNIKPFISILYNIVKLEYITSDEFTYLLPICKSNKEAKDMVNDIKKVRTGQKNVFDIIDEKILSMENYQNVLNEFLTSKNIDIDLFILLNMDRKSSLSTSKIYMELFNELTNFKSTRDSFSKIQKRNALFTILQIIKKISNDKARKHWVKNFINTTIFPRKSTSITDEMLDFFERNKLIKPTKSNEFKTNFFIQLHRIKWCATLEDYYDLNKRFINLTDIFIIEDRKIKLDTIPKYFFEDSVDKLIEEENIHPNNPDIYFQKFHKNQEKLNEISSSLDISLESILPKMQKDYPTLDQDDNIRLQINKILKNNKILRFNNLINKLFSPIQLENLLNNISIRNDKDVKSYTEWDADIPTIFEYLIGVSWYLISDKKDDPTDFFNLSLDANLLPRRFASGGHGDLLFKYDDHNLIIEVTLSESDNQRKMELEPVSRHLGKYLLQTKNKDSYAVFIANNLDPNVLVSFRSYKNLPFYSKKGTEKYNSGLKIIPLNIANLIYILNNNIKYSTLNNMFKEAYKSAINDGFIWYNQEINSKLS